MSAQLRCFECGRELPALPGYLSRMGDIKVRCLVCAEKAQALRPLIPLEVISPEKKQIALHKPRPRRVGLSDEALDALIGLPRAA